ncbi:hypothetical protein C7S20_09065 [Christiangramia fulva]|uniref:Uncharacterized protein n=1 Tax=Christiangramia fulva TaxID=2126553 RepID=A0A2R3Z592_9FLAO|nr:DUF6090 family protein [Christiangramia fulva]AVR45408.1 hypothetical protein C7S20_09065 [Christiangramia fulva]
MKNFRNNRKELIKENRVKKYLLYALGEIILVVIGILIALQVNTWKIDTANRSDEQFYLKKLKQNLQQDTIYLKQRIGEIKSSEEGLELLKKEIHDPQLQKFSNDNAMFNLFAVFSFTPQTSTFDNLISTGKLGLITNQALVDSIFVYYNDLNNFPQQRISSIETYTRNTIGPYLLKFDGVFSNEIRKKPIEYGRDVFINNAISAKKFMIEGLRQDYDFSFQRSIRLMHLISKEIQE